MQQSSEEALHQRGPDALAQDAGAAIGGPLPVPVLLRLPVDREPRA